MEQTMNLCPHGLHGFAGPYNCICTKCNLKLPKDAIMGYREALYRYAVRNCYDVDVVHGCRHYYDLNEPTSSYNVRCGRCKKLTYIRRAEGYMLGVASVANILLTSQKK
jgi:hypothetical protein